MVENSQDESSSHGMQPPLPTLDLSNSQTFSGMREEDGQDAESLCTSNTTLEMHCVHQMMHQYKEGQQERTLIRSLTDLEISCTCKV